MSDFDKMLEGVARSAIKAAYGYDEMVQLDEGSQTTLDNVVSLLKRRLLPLLEAGQAMREISRIRGELWDAAKRQAMEGK